MVGRILFIVYCALCLAQIAEAQEQFNIAVMNFEGDVPVYEKIIELDSTYTQADLYNNAKLYFANAFNDSKEVIRLEDKERGEIIGKGNLPFVWRYLVNHNGIQKFTLEISVKPGKYRARIYDVTLWDDKGSQFTWLSSYHKMAAKGMKQGLSYYEAVHYANLAVLAGIEKAMARKKADW